MTVGEWAARWLPGRPLEPKTREGYLSPLRSRLLPEWADVKLSAVTYLRAVDWAASLTAEGLSASRVRAAVGLLSHMLDDAVRDGRLARNVVRGVDLPRLPSRNRRYLSAEQVAALAAECGEYGLLVRVLAYTGLRIGEAAGLLVGDVDPLRRRLNVQQSLAEVGGRVSFGPTKTHQRRSVVLPRFVADELLPTLAGRSLDELLFTSPEGKPLRLPNFRRRVFDPACARAGLVGVTPHLLRHYAVSAAIASNANSLDVAQMVGHRDPSVTLKVYADLFPDRQDAVADRLDEVGAKAAADLVRTRAPRTVISVIFSGPKRASELR